MKSGGERASERERKTERERERQRQRQIEAEAEAETETERQSGSDTEIHILQPQPRQHTIGYAHNRGPASVVESLGDAWTGVTKTNYTIDYN